VRSFVTWLTVLAVAAALVYFLLGYVMPPKWYFRSYVWIDLLFYIVTFSFHLGLRRSHLKGGKHFIRYYIGATGAKLFFFLLLIVLYGVLNKEEAVSYALAFFYFYFVFTVFEVKIAYSQFGRKAQELKIDN
jgi:hypothetical protein